MYQYDRHRTVDGGLWMLFSMTVKMKDIARELGVSLVTVSKAIRNHPDISTATRERIMKRVEELNYRPNLTARSLVTGRSSLVGLIVPDLLHPFFADVAKGLSIRLQNDGYFVLLSASNEDPELEKQGIEHMLAHHLDAVVIASCYENATPLSMIKQSDTALFLIDRSFADFPAHFVGCDDYLIGKVATEHLLAVGCRHIAHIRGPETSVGKGRLSGFLDTMRKAALIVPDEHVILVALTDIDGRRNGEEIVRQIKKMRQRPDGIFCVNDVVALGVIWAATTNGIRVPEDIAVIGCGNLHYNDQLSVPLSSVDQCSHNIGICTAELILEIMQSGEHEPTRQIILPPTLEARASTARKTRAV